MDLSPATEYSFRVRAENSKYQSSWSNVATATTSSFDPPINLTATAHSSVEIKLEWKDVTNGEDGFVIEYRQSGFPWALADTVAAGVEEFTMKGLDPNTTYEFRIRAFVGGISSEFSNTAQATTLLFLPAPTNLEGTLLSETRIALTWEDNADGESGYEVEHNEDSQGWTLIYTTSADETGYEAQGLTPNTTNAFRVRAVGPGAASGYSNEYSVLTRMKPASPQNLLATAVDHTSIRVTWERGSENEDGYELERKAPGGDWEVLTTSGPGDGDILDENLERMTQYCYRVRAQNDLGYSDWSNEACATTMDIPIPGAPFGLRAEADGPTSITLTWVAPSPSYVETFEIEQSLTGDEGDFSRVPPDAHGKARAHTVDGLDPQTEYYFRIRAVNGSGASDYSNLASATTQGSDEPFRPRNLAAVALGETEIRITWEMPDPSNEDGFEVQRSLTGAEGDFTALSPEPGQGSRTYNDTGLTTGTTYWYRLRSYNSFGQSAWTDTVSATTQKEVITPELRTAMQAKQQVISQVETLIPDGSTELTTLRSLLGDYSRGYDESAATTLIGEWTASGASDATQATEAMKRFTLFEEALRDSWGDEETAPPVAGAVDLGQQCARIPAIATKDIIALALAWKDERTHLGTDDPVVDAGMEDMILALSSNTLQLLALMGADQGNELPALTDDILRNKGEMEDFEAGLMLSLFDYWQEQMLGRYYLHATQPLIAAFADRTEQLDHAGSHSEAESKKDAYLTQLRSEVAALSAGFSDYYRIGTSLDAAYAIGQTPGADAYVFLLRVKGLRSRLTDNMYDALADALIPTERFLYMTSQDAIPDLGSLPSALESTGDAIFDPTQGGIVQHENTLAMFRKSAAIAANPVIDADFAKLQELRSKVNEEDTQYIADEYDALRRSGKNMVAEVDRLQRPLLGVDRAELYQDENLRADYYYTLARLQLLKTRRTVLSVALADYMLSPTTQKQSDLVAEIDSIIGPFNDAQDNLDDLLSNAGSIILLPALSLENACIVSDAAGGSSYQLRFDMRNVGGALAADPTASLIILSSGVTVTGDPKFSFTGLQPDASARDSLAVTIDAGIKYVTLTAEMGTGGRVFIDRRTLLVPHSTTAVEQKHPLPASCLLHQNYPNPFNPTTTIEYGIPSAGIVRLKVFDLLGRELAVLQDGYKHAGVYSVSFDGTRLPSGIYVYQLESSGTVLARRMTLLK